MGKLQEIKKGTILLITKGCNDDYGIVELVKVIKDHDPNAVLDEYHSIYPKRREKYAFDNSEYVGWLINSKKVVERIPFREMGMEIYCHNGGEIWHLSD
jgi:hypothetical protein